MARTVSSQLLKVGEKAPDFRLKGVDDKLYSIRDFRSKTVLVVFICNHCPYVKARIKDIVSLQQTFRSEELQVIGINSNDPTYNGEGFNNMVAFAKENALNFPYLIDDTQNIAKIYGAVCTPDPFLFDSELKLVFHGRINDALEPEMHPKVPIMENNVKKILNGDKIDRPFDPSVGCSIKWKEF